MEIKDALLSSNFRFNKALGQNFITDKNLLSAIVSDAEISPEDTVVEIGAGAGSLTKALASSCKKVISFEIDKNLKPVLEKTLSDCDNVELHFLDVLKLNDEEMSVFVKNPFKVVANLPYYITTPLIMRFVESSLEIKSMTLMMQKEVALRITAKQGTADYGAITAVTALSINSHITRIVPKQLFYPQPKVDSALVYMEFVKNKYGNIDVNFVKKVIKCAFAFRRKTLANNLYATFGISKENAEKILQSLNFQPAVRGEKLSAQNFCDLAKELKPLVEKKS